MRRSKVNKFSGGIGISRGDGRWIRKVRWERMKENHFSDLVF